MIERQDIGCNGKGRGKGVERKNGKECKCSVNVSSERGNKCVT